MTTPDDGSVTWLREFLNEKISHNRELEERDIEKIELQFSFLDANLKLQAKEYERRLAELNHAHAAAVEAQAKTVSREKHEDFVKAYDLNQKEIAKKFTEIDIKLQTIITRSLTWTAAIGLFITIMNIVLRFWK